MRASPALRIEIRRQGVWHAAVAAAVLAAGGVQAAWLAARLPEAAPALGAVLLLVDAVILAGAAGAWRVPALELRWDTRRWWLAPADAPPGPACAGQVAVALDLGAWMLLRFDAQAPAPRPRRRWVPVQRRGLEAHWHALRCAVYCSRPAADDSAEPQRAGPQRQE